MVDNKLFDHKPISELIDIVKSDFKKFNAESLIDEGSLIKTVMYCNDKLGISVREIREAALTVKEFTADLPLDFEKLYYACALECTNTLVMHGRNPFDNNVDQDVIHEAKLNRDNLGCADNYQVVVTRKNTQISFDYPTWIPLSIRSSDKMCHIDCPNRRKKGRYDIEISNNQIHTPFRSGTIYIMYVGMMKDSDGNITFPFHPLITPYYEWCIKEKIIIDAVFNTDKNLGDMLKLAQMEKAKAWLDAFNFSTEKGYGEFVEYQRKKELSWYNQYFKWLQ